MAVRASRAFSTSESSSRTTPSPRKTHWAGRGKKNPSAAATRKHTTAPVIAWRLSRLVTLSPPPLRLEGPEGEEEREHDGGQAVEEMLGVEPAQRLPPGPVTPRGGPPPPSRKPPHPTRSVPGSQRFRKRPRIASRSGTTL